MKPDTHSQIAAAEAGNHVASAGLPAVMLGRVVGTTPSGEPTVTWEGARRPLRAASVWLPGVSDWERCIGAAVALAFIAGDAAQPLIVGLLTPPPPEPVAPPRRLHLEGAEEVVLACGKAKLTMRADGKVALTGEQLLSRATVTNKLQGGSVQIN